MSREITTRRRLRHKIPQHADTVAVTMWWRADAAQRGQRGVVSGRRGLRHLPREIGFLVAAHIHQLPGADIGGDQVGAALEQMDSEDRTPGMGNHHDFVPAQVPAQEVDDLDRVLHHALDRQASASGFAVLVERQAGAALAHLDPLLDAADGDEHRSNRITQIATTRIQPGTL
jgi:hypothetical protein